MTHLTRNAMLLAVAALISSCHGTIAESPLSVEPGEQAGVMDMYMVAPDAEDGDVLFIRSVNDKLTVCADGNLAPACRVDRLDFVYADMHPRTEVEFEGQFRNGLGVIDGWMALTEPHEVAPSAVTLYVVEGWYEFTETPLETPLHTLSPMHVMCIRAPCPIAEAGAINRDGALMVHGLDFSGSHAVDADIEQAMGLLSKDRLLAGGEIVEPKPPVVEKLSWPEGSRLFQVQTLYAPVPTVN